jgi:predicted nuclease of restriction endonuclease-like (RecB) superfamily
MSQLLERYNEILTKSLKFNIQKLVFPFGMVNILPNAIVKIGGHRFVEIVSTQSLDDFQNIANTHTSSLDAVPSRNCQVHYLSAIHLLRGGWSVRQLNRQINSQFYERTALSRNKAAMLSKGEISMAEDTVCPDEEIKDPYFLEFLGLKDEYSETDLEEALIRHLETFLLELGGDFCFIGRQKRLRIGDEWYRVDLVFFHRRLRCMVIIDLKIGKFTHADDGQMHLYLNYAREHWVNEGENPPVGLILCAQKDEAVARYALEGLPNKVMAAEYRTALPNEKELAAEIERTQALLQDRKRINLTW